MDYFSSVMRINPVSESSEAMFRRWPVKQSYDEYTLMDPHWDSVK